MLWVWWWWVVVNVVDAGREDWLRVDNWVG